jgi:hypothetical protein
MDILGKSKTYVVTRSKSKQNEEIENEMATVACPLKYGVSKLRTAIFAVKG